ncbi:NosR/NirI family transcriptional regulator, nitrous oxide reductase regulator [Pseudovibrio sp. Tun.PSC04-5.I4]|nr:NosR/NirI family transcriptional regulator, nitrous oxide reductase regulator [Pseudovibrio sp. Tun.PSC04-5.I4]
MYILHTKLGYSAMRAPWLRTVLLLALTFFLSVSHNAMAATESSTRVLDFAKKVEVTKFFPNADRYGELRKDIAVLPAMAGDKVLGWVFLTTDLVSTTGYSGKPIDTLVGIDPKGILTSVQLVKHAEPIVLIGIPDSEIKKVTENYAGLDIKDEVKQGGSAHELDIISGATVTIMVIDDSVVRGSIKVARTLGLGGLKTATGDTGPKFIIDPAKQDVSNWMSMTGDGTVRRLSMDVGQINAAFAQQGNPKAIKRPEKGPETDPYIDMYLALADVPSVGKTLLGDAEYANLKKRMKEGDHAIVVLGRGRYSFKGTGYVRGGIFDRIQLIQNDISVRFRDRQHTRLGDVEVSDAPSFKELDVFIIPGDAGFDPSKPFRLQLLVNRAIGAIEKTFLTFDLGYQLPPQYLKKVEQAPAVAAANSGQSTSAQAIEETRPELWKRIWNDRQLDIIILGVALTILSGVFFFQMQVSKSARFTFWFRIGFLTFVLFWLGWMQNAQLSVVNVLALFSAITTDFSWTAFLMDPLVFLLWFAVAAALLFWGRGAYCGWLCPFGALQELTNRIAKFFKVPQITVPWGLHERLWPLKYMIFLGLFGMSLYSLALAEHYAEIEPFKTAIILKFQRAWPFVTFVVVLLIVGLFVERFYCRYLCPLGAALAIPARLRMFDWLKRYKECGNPCARCEKECMVQAIHPEGNINPNECLNCLHCQVLYQSTEKCPVCIKKLTKRKKFEAQTGI